MCILLQLYQILEKLPLSKFIRITQSLFEINYKFLQRVMQQILTSLSDKQRQDTLTLMEMFNMPIEEANNIMRQNHYNLECAVAHLFPNQEAPALMVPQQPARTSRMNIYDIDNDEYENDPQFERMGRRERFHASSNRQKVHQFKKTYMIKKKEKNNKHDRKRTRKPKQNQLKEAQNESSSKAEEDVNFYPKFCEMFGPKVNLLLRKDLYQVFEEMLETKKTIAIHCIPLSVPDNSQQYKKVTHEYIKQLYFMKEFAGNFNKNFINYGIDPYKFDYNHYPFMREFINPSKDEFSIIILRLNEHTHRVQKFRSLPISDFFRLNQPERFKIICQTIIKESHRIAHNHSVGIMPMTETQKLKIEEDRMIREQQQMQYMQNMKFQEDLRQREIIQEKEEQKQMETIESVKEKRTSKREKLEMYDSSTIEDGIELKIRLPNSEVLHLKIPKDQTANYLFDYVETYDKEDIGFDDEVKRNFDILQPYEKVSLSKQRQESLRKIFDNSDTQVLVVKQQ